MSLPTPPSTSHRDEKESRPRFSRVSWSEATQYHTITSSPPRTRRTQTTSSIAGPSRSILKKTTYPTLPPLNEETKETTPEPDDPLADLHYLDHPVAQILDANASLRDHTQAYSILSARLRSCLSGNSDADASWPVFQPLRKNREPFVEAIVRDVRLALVDPLESSTPPTDSPTSTREALPSSSLPSPEKSPKKKKGGLSAEQVKHGRDLSGVCNAAMRFLSMVFTTPALYNLFDEKELGFLLTQVLSIPLANELPTPNARKTCALAISVIQMQRLPAEVLEPAKDRITCAIRRGIKGELGKEGKKGSLGDGLKAIHDLALHKPAIFVPAFAVLLPHVIAHLLAPTLVIRNQACHALGGLALATALLPPCDAHTRMARYVASRLVNSPPAPTTPTTPSQKRVDMSPSKDPILVRTLRTTLQADEPKHAAAGPVWAFSVLAHLIVLLGPSVYWHADVTRTVIALFTLGMRHPKTSVRGLACLAWRSMTWAFVRPEHDLLPGEIEVETEIDADQQQETNRNHIRVLASVVDMGAGVSSVAALLGYEVLDDILISWALQILRTMSRRGGQSCVDALQVLLRLLSTASHGTAEENEWDSRKLLSPDFFSANPGLLTAEWSTVPSISKALLEQTPQISDIRTLTVEEIASQKWWDDLLAIWLDGVFVLKMSWGKEEVPSELREIWFNLLKCYASVLRENNDQIGLATLASNSRDVLLRILGDTKTNFGMPLAKRGDDALASPAKSRKRTKGKDSLPHARWSYAVKLFLVRDLFSITRAIFHAEVFADVAEAILAHLNANEEALVGDVESDDEVREQWACLCAEAAFSCDTSVLQAFWENSLRGGQRHTEWNAHVRSLVWQTFVERWQSTDVSVFPEWEGAVVLLCAPHIEPSIWEMSSDDMDVWDGLLRRAIDAALDHGIDSTTLVDQVAGVIAANHSPSSVSAVRVADLLLSNVEIMEARQVPTEAFEFANDVLNGAYPPAPRHKMMCVWLIRSLTRVIDGCPHELCRAMLELLVDGLQTWMVDEFEVFTENDYSNEILPLYQTVLITIQSLSLSTQTLETFGPILAAPFCGRRDKHTGAVDAFVEFWEATYAQAPEPPCGYPESVVQCLDAVAQARLEEQEDEAKVENMMAVDSDGTESPKSVCNVPAKDVLASDDDESSCESEDEGSVVIPSPGTLARTSAFAICDAPVTFVPSTPKTSPRNRSSPVRPQKSAVKDYGTALFDASSPSGSSTMGSSPLRAPTTPKRSPTKQSNGDKENASPLPHLSSVTERLAMRSPLLLESILGKRSRSDDAEDLAMSDEKIAKKGRLAASPLLDFDAAMHDSTNVLKQWPLHAAASTDIFERTGKETQQDARGSPTPSARKRKGVFLDAVEVPPVDQVFARRRASLQEGLSTASCSEPIGSQPPLRRTRSATKLMGQEADFEKLSYSPKKRRTHRVRQLRDEVAEMSSSPLRAIRDAPEFGSDDSIITATPAHLRDLPPSDDEPHMGQVTPHRLVSPSLRRVKRLEFDSDPPSDDSVMSNSPSSERVIRKIAKMGYERHGSNRLPSLGLVRSRSMSVLPSSSSSAHGSDV